MRRVPTVFKVNTTQPHGLPTVATCLRQSHVKFEVTKTSLLKIIKCIQTFSGKLHLSLVKAAVRHCSGNGQLIKYSGKKKSKSTLSHNENLCYYEHFTKRQQKSCCAISALELGNLTLVHQWLFLLIKTGKLVQSKSEQPN